VNGHLDWKQIDLYARGLAEGPIEVHLAECGECAAKLAALRDEEDAVKTALEPGDASDDEIEPVVQAALLTPRAKPARGLSFIPFAAAAALVIALVAIMAYRAPSDPLGDALSKGDYPSLSIYGRKAARWATPETAAKLRELPARVLYTEGEPRAEQAKLEPKLLNDAGLRVHTMLLSSRESIVYRKSEGLTRDVTMFPLADTDLREIDVIVLGDVKAARLATSADVLEAAMRSFVTRMGGTLVCIAGDKTAADDAHHALNSLLPVDLAKSVLVTKDVEVQGIPEALRVHIAAPLRAEGKALVTASGGAPIVSVREVGRGRVVFVASDDIGYGWRTKPSGYYPFYRSLIVE